jgi:hypothetical protein
VVKMDPENIFECKKDLALQYNNENGGKWE